MIESGLCDVTNSNADKTDRVQRNVLEGMLIINLYDFKKKYVGLRSATENYACLQNMILTYYVSRLQR